MDSTYRYDILKYEIVNDKFGAGWELITYKTPFGSKNYAAISGSYEAKQYPFLTKFSSWNKILDAIEEYAAAHQAHRVSETWFNDQNNVGWTIVYREGLITDDYVASTGGYHRADGGRGALIAASSDGDLRGEIFLFANENKPAPVPPPKDPVPPPPVDPTKPPVEPPKPPPPPQQPVSNTGGLVLGGLAVAALIYFLRD